METFKIGDEFIHYTKHGGVNRGVVADIHLVYSTDLTNLCTYYNYSIVTTNGVRLSLDGSDGRIYKISQQLTKERADSISKGVKILADRKHRPHKDIIHKVNED